MTIYTQHADASGFAPLRFWRWWTNALAAALAAPGRARRKWSILFYRAAGGTGIYVRRAGQVEEVARLADNAPPAEIDIVRSTLARYRRGGTAVLRLGPNQVLQKTLTLPAAVQDVLEPVLRNQIERIAPWPQEETCFGYSVAREAARPGQVSVEVVITSRVKLDEGIDLMRRMGIEPVSADFSKEAASDRGVALITLDTPRKRGAARAIGWLIAMVFAGALGAGGFGFADMLNKQQQLSDLQQQIARVRQEADEVTRLYRAKEDLRRHGLELVTRKQNRASSVVLLEQLSRALPDSVWLTSLELKGLQARLLGRAENAAALITTLESLPTFTGVQFAAPTTRRGNEKTELFSITANTAPGVGIPGQAR